MGGAISLCSWVEGKRWEARIARGMWRDSLSVPAIFFPWTLHKTKGRRTLAGPSQLAVFVASRHAAPRIIVWVICRRVCSAFYFAGHRTIRARTAYPAAGDY